MSYPTIKDQKTKASNANRLCSISTDKLQSMLTGSTSGKYKDAIRKELMKRGV